MRNIYKDFFEKRKVKRPLATAIRVHKWEDNIEMDEQMSVDVDQIQLPQDRARVSLFVYFHLFVVY
jgi:hypothetical protein